MRALIVSLSLALGLSACATAPEPKSELALAREVFELSGGFSEAREIVRLGVPFALSEIDDVGERCRRAVSGPLSAAACEIAVGALQSAQAGRVDIVRALDAQLRDLERRAPQALADTYTYEELEAMRDFYASAGGRGVVEKRAQFWGRLIEGG